MGAKIWCGFKLKLLINIMYMKNLLLNIDPTFILQKTSKDKLFISHREKYICNTNVSGYIHIAA